MQAATAGPAAITDGAGAGIGRASALALAAEGVHVMVTDIDPSVAEKTAAEIQSAGGSAAIHRVDIGNENDIVAVIAAAVQAFGGLHIMHNNAADTSFDTMQRGDGNVQTLDPITWDHTMQVNLKGTMLCIRHGIPELLRSHGGSIINTSTITSFMGLDCYTAYTVAKAGINQLTRNVAEGISRALITTATGLFVAIPALFLINWIKREFQRHELRILEQKMRLLAGPEN